MSIARTGNGAVARAIAHAPDPRRAPLPPGGWVYEEKYHGWRLVAHKADDRVRLISRNGLDHARRFPELAAAIAALPATASILDGEVAIFDEQLISRFEWLRHRHREAVATPPIYMIFDVLLVGGEDLRRLPLRRGGGA